MDNNRVDDNLVGTNWEYNCGQGKQRTTRQGLDNDNDDTPGAIQEVMRMTRWK